MTVDQVQSNIKNLQSAIHDERYLDAENLMKEFMTDFPDYHTPLILYVDLHPYIDAQNPLYGKILELTRQYSQFQDFPPDLIPSWYKKVMAKNLRIQVEEDEPMPANSDMPSDVQMDLSDDESDMLDDLIPDSVPYKDEEPEEQGELVDPHSFVDDMDEDVAPARPVAEAHDPDDEIMIASETMAEIFAQQKKYAKAIRVYEMLIVEEPELTDDYNERISELKDLMAGK